MNAEAYPNWNPDKLRETWEFLDVFFPVKEQIEDVKSKIYSLPWGETTKDREEALIAWNKDDQEWLSNEMHCYLVRGNKSWAIYSLPGWWKTMDKQEWKELWSKEHQNNYPNFDTKK